jgi:hypothetical protein
MSRENENSIEYIKQKLEFKKEKLKFLNSFYLPLGSGITVLIVSTNSVSSWDNAIFFLFGLIIFGFILLEKRRVLKEIDSLIKELKKDEL